MSVVLIVNILITLYSNIFIILNINLKKKKKLKYRYILNNVIIHFFKV